MDKDDKDFWLESGDDVLRRRMVQGNEDVAKKPVKPVNPTPVKDIAEPGTFETKPQTKTVNNTAEPSIKPKKNAVTRIAFEIKMPKLSVPTIFKKSFSASKQHLRKIPRPKWSYSNRNLAIAGSLLLVLIVGSVALLSKGGSDAGNDSATSTAKAKPKPTFKYLVPLSNTKNKEKEVRFSTETKTVSISDRYLNSSIVLTQQNLDEKTASNPVTLINAANGIASAFKLTILSQKVVKTGKGDFYYYDAGKDGQQRGVFLFNKLLIFAYSEKNLKADDWKDYIESLNVSK